MTVSQALSIVIKFDIKYISSKGKCGIGDYKWIFNGVNYSEMNRTTRYGCRT